MPAGYPGGKEPFHDGYRSGQPSDHKQVVGHHDGSRKYPARIKPVGFILVFL